MLIDSALRPDLDELSDESTIYDWGADRSAAVGLPTLLLPPFDGMRLDRAAIEQALHNCATSLSDEVRAAFALGVAAVWAAPCGKMRESGVCRHEVAWAAAQSGLRDCRLGD